MAITIDYSDDVTPQYVIQIPRADMVLVQTVPTEIRQLNIDDFRRQLDDLMDNDVGMVFETTHYHTPPLTVSGVTLARVLEIFDPYVIEFEDGLYNVNIVGGNSNVSDVVVKNQVGVNTANSAGLQDPFALQAAAYAGVIHIDASATQSGTTSPYGTRQFPVNNLVDAKTVAVSRGINTLWVIGSFDFLSTDVLDGYKITGDGDQFSTITLDGTSCVGTSLSDVSLSGSLSVGSHIQAEKCRIGDLSELAGSVSYSSLLGTFTLSDVCNTDFAYCVDGIPGSGAPIVVIGDAPGVGVWDYNGGIIFRTLSNAACNISVNMAAGRLVLDPDISAGSFLVKGVGLCTDNTTGTASVSVAGLISKYAVVDAIEESIGPQIAYSSFNGEVALDQDAANPDPDGLPGIRSNPTNTVAGAVAACEERGIRRILLLSDTILGSGDFSDGYNFAGDNANLILTILSTSDVTRCTFTNLTVQGDLDGRNTLQQCAILSLNYFSGYVFQCGFYGAVSLQGTDTAVIMQSFSLVPDGLDMDGFPKIDLGGTQVTPLVIRDWVGALSLINCSDQQAHTSIDFSSGTFRAEDTVTDGVHVVRGILSQVVDDSGPGATIVDQTMSTVVDRVRKHQTNRLETDPVTGVARLYDDDGVTLLEQSDLFEDIDGAQPYRGRGAERRDGFS